MLARFLFDHLMEHRDNIAKLCEEIENNRNQLYQRLIEQKEITTKPALIQKVNDWEEDSIKKIKKMADECRQTIVEHRKMHFKIIEKTLSQVSEHLNEIRGENELNEADLNTLKVQLVQLANELREPSNIKLEHDHEAFIDRISIKVSPSKISFYLIYIQIFLNEKAPPFDT